MIETEPERSLAEWITFGIALSILAVVISLVGYMWLNEKNQPPILSVHKKQMIREIDGKFYVPFEIVNTGGETAESVQIIAELQIADKVVETGEQQIDFLSDGEKEEGAFIFSQNPRHGQLTVRVASYKLP
ncbi:TIGR02588 family protein [Anabaena catenula]|uniref:TIGR02588 family protein n=1 Tax=Anabaena catenula FACHB-362 TaxID=2692877 RepID=A0ABR8IYZ8_9NOST|nr:TIGR02588 family protein [Anabaena catenula]MBD2690462.1 TIGR02588 family protein [Anabaena catenula FACHB-362]